MKLFKLALLVVCGSLLLTVAKAQDAQKKGGDRGAQMQQQMDDWMTKQGLSDANKEKLKAVLQTQREKMMGLRDKTDLSQEQRREEMTKIREAGYKKIQDDKILTEDQLAKFKEFQAQMYQGRGGQGGKKKQQ